MLTSFAQELPCDVQLLLAGAGVGAGAVLLFALAVAALLTFWRHANRQSAQYAKHLRTWAASEAEQTTSGERQLN